MPFGSVRTSESTWHRKPCRILRADVADRNFPEIPKRMTKRYHRKKRIALGEEKTVMQRTEN